jgi:uncharacterized protein involved in exopolysaccharide biosynthesis
MLLSLLGPRALCSIIHRRLRLIALLALGPLVLLATAVAVTPPSYTATALVLVDSRERRTLREEPVLPGFGTDALAVGTVAELAQSDGFLSSLLQTPALHQPLAAAGVVDLDTFKQRLRVARLGLTYLVSVSFRAGGPEVAALMANGIASALVTANRERRDDVVRGAGAQLESKLPGLRSRALAADDDVASSKAANGVIELSNGQTTEQLKSASLARSLSTARLMTLQARARLEQATQLVREGRTDGIRSELLDGLKERRAQLMDELARKRAVLGNRHPELASSEVTLRQLDTQIRTERTRSLDSLRSEVAAAEERETALGQSLEAAESQLAEVDRKEVKTRTLERQARIETELQRRHLERAKYLHAFSFMSTQDVQLASSASVPSRSKSHALVVASIAVMILLLATASAIVFFDPRELDLRTGRT